MITAQEALQRLREGNARFVDGRSMYDASATPDSIEDLATGQAPFAVVLGCADSRVPPELIFDEGLGDLFVLRVAGNIAASTQVASIEFAAARLGSRLVVVLGHTSCGAVQATVDAVETPGSSGSADLDALVDRIRPCVEPLWNSELRHDREALVATAVRANVAATAQRLREGSGILKDLIRDDGLQVVGAKYTLKTGSVDFFDMG